MKIYITGEIGRIMEYSLIRCEPNFVVKVKLEEEANPLDYVWNGSEAVYDELVPSELERTEFEKMAQMVSELEIKDLEKTLLMEQLGQTVTDLEIQLLEIGGN